MAMIARISSPFEEDELEAGCTGVDCGANLGTFGAVLLLLLTRASFGPRRGCGVGSRGASGTIVCGVTIVGCGVGSLAVDGAGCTGGGLVSGSCGGEGGRPGILASFFGSSLLSISGDLERGKRVFGAGGRIVSKADVAIGVCIGAFGPVCAFISA